MKRFILQNYSDGKIYKHDDGSYSVVTSRGSGSGVTVSEALSELSTEINSRYISPKKIKKVTHKKKISKIVDSE